MFFNQKSKISYTSMLALLTLVSLCLAQARVSSASWQLALQAAMAKRPMTVEDLWAVKRVGGPSLSPDGRWAAVEVVSYDMKENNSTSDLWLLSTDGRTQRRLTTHTARDSSPLWSPDGKFIAFISKREGDEQNQIYLISPAGGEARRLTKISTGASSPKWFPDSKHIAFISWVWPDLKTDEDQAKRLKEQKDSKVKAYVIDTTSYRYWDHWLADGRAPHLFVVDVESGEQWDVLAGTGLSLVRYDPSASLYDVSPDGSEIALTTDLTKDPGFDPNADIVTIPTRGGHSAGSPSAAAKSVPNHPSTGSVSHAAACRRTGRSTVNGSMVSRCLVASNSGPLMRLKAQCPAVEGNHG